MQSIKNKGRILGALFLGVMVFWFIGYVLLDPILNAPEYLTTIFPNKSKITIGVLFELIEVAGVLGITYLLYPVLKKHSDSLALGYFGFRVFESMMLIVAILCPLILITLSEQYIQVGTEDASYFETLGLLLKTARADWSLYVLAFFHPLAALPLYYFLHKTKLVPRFLSIWGFLAALLVLIDQSFLESFGLGLGRIGGNPITGIPMGLNEIFLGIWLMIKGFNKSTLFFELDHSYK